LTDDEQAELKGLWRKLVRVYHPDRFASDPEKRATYEKLTALINRARDEGDIGLLRDIANDPTGFIARQGWGSFDFQERGRAQCPEASAAEPSAQDSGRHRSARRVA